MLIYIIKVIISSIVFLYSIEYCWKSYEALEHGHWFCENHRNIFMVHPKIEMYFNDLIQLKWLTSPKLKTENEGTSYKRARTLLV